MNNSLRTIVTRAERGVSLFEVLITVVVVSIGLLGLAGLQFAGLHVADSAQDHTLATLLVQDIAERIKANSDGTAAGDYDMVTLSTGGATPPAPSQDCFTAACDTTDMSKFDALQWYNMINSGGPNTIVLPNASIRIGKCSTSSNFKITIQWNGANDASNPCDSNAPTGPSTLVAIIKP